ncbi:MAG: hypothetical protein A3K19_08110 [Lentisphaerae bacterium RIFOXYB12_FULL_65_16]|nr:MAG: hypothetical protein A3K18_27960 [Lentisphaerae bacterium RIFOXYA12_64_32]OGV84901.1 MAG: hypothetical protein A3K19_08110 [Lentisphaerae bacterium RIFOXYB12_FULL_65_16]
MADLTRRDLVLAQLRGEATPWVPSTLGFEGDVAERLDAFHGSPVWRQHVANDIVRFCPFDSEGRQPIDATHVRDAFGTEWRMDLRPSHLEKPGLEQPSFDGYAFPSVEQFRNPENEKRTREALENCADRFRAIRFGFGLFERTWTIRGFENSLMDAAAAVVDAFMKHSLGR